MRFGILIFNATLFEMALQYPGLAVEQARTGRMGCKTTARMKTLSAVTLIRNSPLEQKGGSGQSAGSIVNHGGKVQSPIG